MTHQSTLTFKATPKLIDAIGEQWSGTYEIRMLTDKEFAGFPEEIRKQQCDPILYLIRKTVLHNGKLIKKNLPLKLYCLLYPLVIQNYELNMKSRNIITLESMTCLYKIIKGKTIIKYGENKSADEILKWYGREDTPEKYVENPTTDKHVLVLIPVYNSAKTLPIWFNFLYKLNPQPTEYVFAENNSTDNTLETIIKKFKRPYKLIRVWFKNKPIGKGESPYNTIAHIRQLLLTYARNSGCDYAIFLDSDVFPVSVDIIKRLINRKKNLVGGNYTRFRFIASYFFNENSIQLKQKTGFTFEEIVATSAGCMCLSKNIIQDRRISFYPLLDKYTAEDLGYCLQARRHGYKVYLDNKVELLHYFKWLSDSWHYTKILGET